MVLVLAGITSTIRKQSRQLWRDLLSVYYANTPTWRWLKSGALLFFGFFLWTGGAVVLSVRPEWGLLTYLMAYGFLLIVWGPLTHLVIVPLTIRLRRTAKHPVARSFSRNSGKINLTIFFTLVLVFGAFTPSIMVFEFSPGLLDGNGDSFSGDLVCDTTEELIVCHVENAAGIDHVTVESGGEVVASADEPSYRTEFDREALRETRTGKEFRVIYRDADGGQLQVQVRTVRESS